MIVDFNRALARESEDRELDPAKIGPGVVAVLADGTRGRYFVASFGEEIVGQLMHTWEWSDWRNGEIWWVQSVYVHPEHRGRGVFRMLWNHVRGLAREQANVVGLRLYVEHRNGTAQDAYRKLGLRDAGYIVMEELFDGFREP